MSEAKGSDSFTRTASRLVYIHDLLRLRIEFKRPWSSYHLVESLKSRLKQRPMVISQTLPPSGIAPIPSNKFPHTKNQPNQICNANRCSTQTTRLTKPQKSPYCRVSSLRPHNMQDPSDKIYSADTIYHEIQGIHNHDHLQPRRLEID